ncbi:unnamed protein product [Leptidea sinapis]|uniref:Uncharacterized protein n=1 Tax=Leptidea sinapis TaxID=189913 RepID=A0A5E4PWU2_9NEOP|nr:unnamed protein product [Leptidea sinapis]
MLPQTTYSTAQMILRNWVNRHRIVPCDLEIQTLARSLRDFSYGFILDTLESFLTSDRIIHIASQGLRSQDIHEYFLQNGTQPKTDHDKYKKWFTDKTHWGKFERKALEERLQFKEAVLRWKEKEQKKKKKMTH